MRRTSGFSLFWIVVCVGCTAASINPATTQLPRGSRVLIFVYDPNRTVAPVFLPSSLSGLAILSPPDVPLPSTSFGSITKVVRQMLSIQPADMAFAVKISLVRIEPVGAAPTSSFHVLSFDVQQFSATGDFMGRTTLLGERITAFPPEKDGDYSKLISWFQRNLAVR